MSDATIVVVGAGPTGLTLAAELARRGVACRVLESRDAPMDRSRAVGLSTRSLEVLDGFGAAEEAVDLGHQLVRANLYSAGRPIGSVSTDGLRGTRFPFVLSSPQSNTEQVLLNAVTKLGVQVEWGTTLTGLTRLPDDSGVEVVLDGPGGREELRADWLIGADGAHSAVRKLSGLSFDGEATEIEFAIVDSTVDSAPARGAAHYFLSPHGLLVVVPLPDGGYRFAATLPVGTEQVTDLDLAGMRQVIAERAPGAPIELTELHDAGWGAARVRIHTRLASAQRAGRCVIAGDAAHIHSPVGGQGVNVGIQDAHNLGWKLALVASGQAPAALVDSYAAERRPVAQLVSAGVGQQTALATMADRAKARVRDLVIARATARGSLDRMLVPVLAQIGINYTGSPAVGDQPDGTPGLVTVGMRLPDTPLRGPDDAPRSLHQLLAGAAPFTVLVLGGRASAPAPVDAAQALAERRPGLLDVRVLNRDEPDAPVSEALVDPGDALHTVLNVEGVALVLLRPDGHVAAIGPDAGPLTSYLDRVLDPA